MDFPDRAYLRIENNDGSEYLLAEADLGDGVPEGDTVLVGIYKLERIVRASWRKEVIARDVRRPSARAKKKAKRKARR